MKKIKDGDKYLVEIDVDEVAATRDAVLVFDGSKEAWIPKSHISDSEKEDGKLISIIIPEWIAYEKGLI